MWETLRTKLKGFPSLFQAPGPAKGKMFSQGPEKASSKGRNTSRLPKTALSPASAALPEAREVPGRKCQIHSSDDFQEIT